VFPEKMDLIKAQIFLKKKLIPSTAAIIACTRKLPLPGSIYMRKFITNNPDWFRQ